jgi:hypothetical protein
MNVVGLHVDVVSGSTLAGNALPAARFYRHAANCAAAPFIKPSGV